MSPKIEKLVCSWNLTSVCVGGGLKTFYTPKIVSVCGFKGALKTFYTPKTVSVCFFGV